MMSNKLFRKFSSREKNLYTYFICSMALGLVLGLVFIFVFIPIYYFSVLYMNHDHSTLTLYASENLSHQGHIVQPIFAATLHPDKNPCLVIYLQYWKDHQFELGLSFDKKFQMELLDEFLQRNPACARCSDLYSFFIYMDNFVEVLDSNYSLNSRDRETIIHSFIHKVLLPSGYQFESIEDFWDKFIDFLPDHRKAEFNQFKNDFIKKEKIILHK